MCSPVMALWRETFELWDLVCYGIGKLYYKFLD